MWISWPLYDFDVVLWSCDVVFVFVEDDTVTEMEIALPLITLNSPGR